MYMCGVPTDNLIYTIELVSRQREEGRGREGRRGYRQLLFCLLHIDPADCTVAMVIERNPSLEWVELDRYHGVYGSLYT